MHARGLKAKKIVARYGHDNTRGTCVWYGWSCHNQFLYINGNRMRLIPRQQHYGLPQWKSNSQEIIHSWTGLRIQGMNRNKRPLFAEKSNERLLTSSFSSSPLEYTLFAVHAPNPMKKACSQGSATMCAGVRSHQYYSSRWHTHAVCACCNCWWYDKRAPMAYDLGTILKCIRGLSRAWDLATTTPHSTRSCVLLRLGMPLDTSAICLKWRVRQLLLQACIQSK